MFVFRLIYYLVYFILGGTLPVVLEVFIICVRQKYFDEEHTQTIVSSARFLYLLLVINRFISTMGLEILNSYLKVQ